MNVGARVLRPMLKVHPESGSREPPALIILAFILLLAGCGQISLSQLMESEQPGEFRASPGQASVPIGSTVIVQGQGGFLPYTYVKLAGEGDLDSESGAYTTPADAEVAEIEATDRFGRSDVSIINVFEPLSLTVDGQPVHELTIYDTQTVDFQAQGGSVSDGYDYYVDDVLQAENVANGRWTFTPLSVGPCVVDVQDDLENSAAATVHVVPQTGPNLAISPAEANLLQGAAVLFRGLNVEGAAHYAASPGVGSFAPSGDDALYTAPGDYEGAVVVTLSDASESVSATVYVFDDELEPLRLSPSSATLRHGDEVIFTVTGGWPPYTFQLYYIGDHGNLEQIGDDRARYTAPESKTTDWVWVRDSAGSPPQRAKVKVK